MNMEKLEIEKLIENLLHHYECVIMPDFGGFIIRDSPCNFNAAKDKLKPYGKHIFFNPHLTQNDGLLYNEIQKNRGLSYQDSVNAYQNWLSVFKQTVSEAGSKSFGQLGTFYKGNENSVWFTPLSSLNLALESYGLYPVDVKQVAGIEQLAEQPYEAEPAMAETLADNKPIASVEPARLNYKGWLVAASIALVAHIGYLSFEKSDVTVNEASVIPVIENKTPKHDSAEIADSARSGGNQEQVSEPVQEQSPAPVEEVTGESGEKTETGQETPGPAVDDEKQTPVIDNTPGQPQPSGTPKANEKSLNRVAKYKLESNANYHRDDLIKKGIKAEVKLEGEWFEVLTEETIQ
mgnify:CR=1 FL=1